LANITSFLKELRRRNVFKVGMAYAIVAWLLMQLTAIAVPALYLPGWTLSLITYLLIIGFPLILLFAWAFEITPEGFKPTHHVELDESITSITGRKFDFIIIGLMAVAIIFLLLDNYVWVEEASPPVVTTTTETKTEEKVEPVVVTDRKSIAVLPFANRSKSEDDVYFVDGIHDDILTQLQKITDMKVISRTSVMQYRDTQKTMKTIGEELGVATLLEGGVQRAGKQVRINVQLIDANKDEHLWAEVYDRELTAANIFAIQSEIATAIANALLATLSPEEQERIAAVPTENLAAYEAYLLGKQRMAKRTSAGLAEAMDYFQQAITLDPKFALAYVGLSVTYYLQIYFSGLPQEEMFSKAEAAINKALALDDKLGEAYTALGALKEDMRDNDGAEAAFKKALTLNPNYAATYNWYGDFQSERGDHEEALALHRKGAELDPLSPILQFDIGRDLERLGRFDEALAQYEKTIEIGPDSPLGYWGKGDYYWFVSGQLDEGLRWVLKSLSLDPDSPPTQAYISYLYWDLGDDEQAECWANRAIELAPESGDANMAMQALYFRRGNETQTLKYAHKTLEIRDWWYWPYSLAVLRHHDVRMGNYIEARARYEKRYPALLAENKPKIGYLNYRVAIDLAAILQLTGEQERADWLLSESLKYVQGIQRLGIGGHRISDVQIYALQGKTQRALTALRQAIDDGWRSFFWSGLERNLNLESIRNKPEFQAMVEEIKADMAIQLARVREMEKEGDACVNP
jgi:TolB-like protein/Tfp pilus assembly protein PilF